MQLIKLFTDDNAVSPVIGVILMVAITVILAAVIAAFVLGLGESSEVGPQVSFNYDYDQTDEELRITVQSGDAFTASQVTFSGSDLGNNSGVSWDERSDAAPGDSVSAGERAHLGPTQGGDQIPPTFDLDIVWTSSDGDDSNIIGSRSGPDA